MVIPFPEISAYPHPHLSYSEPGINHGNGFLEIQWLYNPLRKTENLYMPTPLRYTGSGDIQDLRPY